MAATRHGNMRRVRTTLVALVLTALVSGCSVLPWWDDEPGDDVSVFDLKVGDCTLTPTDVTVEITELRRVDCTEEHQLEMYAIVPYTESNTDEAPQDRPTEDVLNSFADGACAAAFNDYVGIDYRDSSLFFTYLLPTARSWEQNDDANITCFVTTTGAMLTSSVKSTKL